MGERIRPDLGLRVCMAVVLLLEAAVTVAVVAGLVWVTLFVDRGWSFTVFALLLAVLGARASVASGRGPSRARKGAGRPRAAAARRRAPVRS
jgi:small-conductance mechanosensitive channel